ncbi:hypothetical protein C6I20_08125 [Aeromicrobium sp. A1-2]|uniref:hypothetical protein n=1 Tax=Aeromicrobium sp. A1-2 TaxID=2107713 RepID=UPI000E510D6B|nr:hypothetical protein [Aeromicrobium sp. A1-2]AXT85154.1 hypothetical protein C6I20_08125 [Aeromicrobium sp. A1-2]
MALIVCPLCVREDDVFLVSTLPDGRKEARCDDCNFTFVYGAPVVEKKPAPRKRASSAAKPSKPTVVPAVVVQKRFPTAADVTPEAERRAFDLTQQFLATVPPADDAQVASYWAKFAWVFSEAGIDKAVISDLKLFVTDPTGAALGDTTELDKAWLLLGEFESARRIRAMIAHLIRGTGAVEDRLTDLVEGHRSNTMPGVGEPALTKVLAVVQPERFLPLVTYDTKRATLAAVYGLELPKVDPTSWTIGRLAVWSNDLLVELLGAGFTDMRHAVAFLRWAEDQPAA